MFGRETILNKIPAGGGCTDIVDNYDPFDDSSGLALYKFNGDSTDESGNYSFSTASNVSYPSGVFNESLDLLSNTSYVSGSGLTSTFPLTFSFWVKPDASANAVGLLINKRTTATNGYSITGTGTTNEMGFLNNGGYAGGGTGIANNLATNTWSHIVVIMNTSGWESYVNGSYYNKYSGTLNNNSNEIRLGKSSGIGNWVGSTWGLDQFRVFNRELTPLEIEALYTEEICICDGTVDTLDILGDGSCIATYPLDGNANDLSGNYSGTPTDVSYGVGEFDLAGVFNGTSSFIDTNAKIPASLNFSVSFWMKSSDTSSGSHYIFSTKGNYLTNGWLITNDAGYIRYGEGNGVDNATDQVSPSIVADGSWNHVVVTRAAGGTVNIYVNNSRVITDGSVGTYFMTSSTWANDLHIGRYSGGSGVWYDGELDQVRIFNKSLNSTEVTTLYNETACTKAACTGTTNTLDILGDGSCIAAYPLDGSPADLSGNYNGVQTDVTYPQGEFDLAGSFNGSSSKIDLPNFMPSGNASRSVSMWINTTQTTAATLLQYGGGNTNLLFNLRINDGGAGGGANTIGIGFYANDFNRPATGLMDGNWHHIAATYDGTNAKIYIDGVQTGADFATGGVNTTASSGLIGSNGGSFIFNGSIDQVRIFNKALSAGEVTTLYNETPCN
jgi:hypothetical protein